MKRIKTAGLAAVVVFAMSAVIATAAQAGEYGKCLKIAGAATHKYTDKNCQEESAGGNTGKFEWTPVAAGSHIETTSTGKEAVLAIPALSSSVVCTKSSDVGFITGPTTDEDVVTFEKCTTAGKKCTSAGQAAGVIVTNLIETIVIDEPENVVKIKLQAKAGGVEGYQAEFNCEGLEVRTKGYTEGLNEGNVNEMSTTSTLTFAGETTLETEVNLGSGFIGPFESGETTVAKVKGEKLEIKT